MVVAPGRALADSGGTTPIWSLAASISGARLACVFLYASQRARFECASSFAVCRYRNLASARSDEDSLLH